MISKPNKQAPLNGLILSGGRSSRMGKDKALIPYHGISQLDYLTQLLGSLCEHIFISSKNDRDYSSHKVITDKYTIESPLNGILSAMTLYPRSAWLVIACDMPLINLESLEYLVSHRSRNTIAICYKNEEEFTEPLFSIWEPQAYSKLKIFHLNGHSSPKRFLETNGAKIIVPKDFKVLTNVNTIEEFEDVKKRLSQSLKWSG